MATNQVIHGSNRVVENPNRYKLNAVSGQANTYDLEKVPGVITDNGTPYNKLILDKIDNVLSYLTPSVEKTEHIETISDSGVTSLIPVIQTTGSYITSLTTKCLDTNHINLDMTSSNVNSLPEMFDSDNTNYSVIQSSGYIVFEFEIPILINNIRAVAYASSSTAANKRVYIDASNDNENWTSLASHDFNTSSEDYTFELTPTIQYKYYRFKKYNGSGSIYVYSIDINKWEYNSQKLNIVNEFELDNNGNTFTNNQRVLIETDKNVEEVEKTLTSNILPTNISRQWVAGDTFNSFYEELTSYDGITPTLTYSTNNMFRAGTGSDVTIRSNIGNFYDSQTFFNTSKQISYNSDVYNNFIAYGYYDISLIFDMKTPSIIKLNYRIDIDTLWDNYEIQASNDNINWTKLANISDNVASELESQAKYRYYKVYFKRGERSTNGNVKIHYLYISKVVYNIIEPAPYQDVTSNTLNGIEIDTLLQPSKYYELLYNEENERFIAEEVRNAN